MANKNRKGISCRKGEVPFATFKLVTELEAFSSEWTVINGPTAAKMLEVVKWNGVEIRMPPLELQLRVSEHRELNDRIEKIKLYQQSQL